MLRRQRAMLALLLYIGTHTETVGFATMPGPSTNGAPGYPRSDYPQLPFLSYRRNRLEHSLGDLSRWSEVSITAWLMWRPLSGTGEVKSRYVVYDVVVRFFDVVVQAVSAAGAACCSVDCVGSARDLSRTSRPR